MVSYSLPSSMLVTPRLMSGLSLDFVQLSPVWLFSGLSLISLFSKTSCLIPNFKSLDPIGRGSWDIPGKPMDPFCPMGNPGRLIVLKALAARRDRWDLRWSLRLPDAVYILPQKSHLKFLNILIPQRLKEDILIYL